MTRDLAISAGIAGICFGLMFFLDPKCGKHRRTVAAHSMGRLGKHIGKSVAWPIARIV